MVPQTAKASSRFQRIAPRKARKVIDMIRGKPVDDALAILHNTPRRAAEQITKVLNSAVANAVNNFEMDEDELYISECHVDEGSTLKRWRPRAMGRAAPINKRTSHINIVVAEREEV